MTPAIQSAKLEVRDEVSFAYVWHRVPLILVLSVTAGWVDCVCYIALYHVFVANMTGNTIAAGIGVGQTQWRLLFRRGLAIPMYVLGMILSRFWMKWACDHRGWPKEPSRYVYAEALVLAHCLRIRRFEEAPSTFSPGLRI